MYSPAKQTHFICHMSILHYHKSYQRQFQSHLPRVCLRAALSSSSQMCLCYFVLSHFTDRFVLPETKGNHWLYRPPKGENCDFLFQMFIFASNFFTDWDYFICISNLFYVLWFIVMSNKLLAKSHVVRRLLYHPTVDLKSLRNILQFVGYIAKCQKIVWHPLIDLPSERPSQDLV